MSTLRLVSILALVGCGGVEDVDANMGNIDGAPGSADARIDAGCNPSAAELCNSFDDDCDTDIDEDFPEVGMTCDGADDDDCEEGVFVCSGDGTVTICNDSSGDTPELCNGSDDDCDGVDDDTEFDLGGSCDGSGDTDMCNDGARECDGAMSGTQCNDPGPNRTESCNGADDDCDLSTDEGTCSTGQRCDGASGCQCDTSSGCGGCCDGSEACHTASTTFCNVNGGACMSCGFRSNNCSPTGTCRCGTSGPCSTQTSSHCTSGGACACGNGAPCTSTAQCCSADGNEVRRCVSLGMSC